MYKLVRNVHLFVGLFSAAFLFAYGLSAVQMGHPVFGRFMQPEHVTRMIAVAPEETESARELAAHLMTVHDVRGDLMKVDTASTTHVLHIERPGVESEVRYRPGDPSVVVTIERAGVLGTLNRIHHVVGLWHDDWVINAWATYLGIVSALLLVIGATGVYLWFRRKKERSLGYVMLALNLGWAVTILVFVRLS